MKNKTSNRISRLKDIPKYLLMFCFLFLPILTKAQEASESLEYITLKTGNDLNFLLLIFFDIIIFLYAYNTITKQ
jgi:hypothetical protein